MSDPAAPLPVDAPGVSPVLRTLSPLLKSLESKLRAWLDAVHRFPLTMIQRAGLEGLTGDLQRQSEALDVDRPLLVVTLMGGTGVGKSTLMNALAGAPIAQASYTRPTTREPVVYYHHSVRTERLDPALRHCRLVQHDRDSLAQKVLIDTPDLDSNDLNNRDKLFEVLPVADVVLYVGSQEKYHDKLGWELFKHQRKRRAFAFVLNKWDRCLHGLTSGVRPDEDLLRDLHDEGFAKPLLFRTVAQKWLDFRTAPQENGATKPSDLPEGEQFAELLDWLEMGLTRLEIEAVKTRGVEQLLQQLEEGIEQVRPPDLSEPAKRTQEAWERVLTEEAAVFGEVLLSTLDPYQTEIEHHFKVQSQQKFRGFMALYLRMTSRISYTRTSLASSLLPTARQSETVQAPPTWNVSAFAHECTRVAGEKVLNQRGSALVNRLLVEADQCQFPVALLNARTNQAAREDWQTRYDRVIIEALSEVERSMTRPTGFRKYYQATLYGMANSLPEVAFVGGYIVLLWRFFMDNTYHLALLDVLLPFVVTIVILILLQVMISILLPMRWSAVRGEFHGELVLRLEQELARGYVPIPAEVASDLRAERERVERLLQDVREVRTWFVERQQNASISELYGN